MGASAAVGVSSMQPVFEDDGMLYVPSAYAHNTWDCLGSVAALRGLSRSMPDPEEDVCCEWAPGGVGYCRMDAGHVGLHEVRTPGGVVQWGHSTPTP